MAIKLRPRVEVYPSNVRKRKKIVFVMDRDSGVLCIVTIVHFQLQLIQSASDDYIDIVANHAWFVFDTTVFDIYIYVCVKILI
jgi:hypothetical protein